MIAWLVPLPPTEYIGCAASPSGPSNECRPHRSAHPPEPRSARRWAFEGRHDAVAALREPDQPARGVDASRSEPLDGGLVKHAKELAAMHAELRHIVSGVDAAQFVPHDLTETIVVDQFADPDTGPLQRGKQAKSGQNS